MVEDPTEMPLFVVFPLVLELPEPVGAALGEVPKFELVLDGRMVAKPDETGVVAGEETMEATVEGLLVPEAVEVPLVEEEAVTLVPTAGAGVAKLGSCN